MKLGVATSPIGRRRITTRERARRRDERINQLRLEAEAMVYAPWTPPKVIRFPERKRST